MNPAHSIVTPAADTVMQVSVESMCALSVQVFPGVEAQVLQPVQSPQAAEIVRSELMSRVISVSGEEDDGC